MGNPAGSNRWGLPVYGPAKFSVGPATLPKIRSGRLRAAARGCRCAPGEAELSGDRKLTIIVVRLSSRDRRAGSLGPREDQPRGEDDGAEAEVDTDRHQRAPQHQRGKR